MTEFKPRLTKPERGNPYYNTVANGGWSPAIKGSPTDADCDVLSNCFTGDTKIITRDGVVRLDSIEGKEVMVLSKGGVYRHARGAYFGVQKMYKVIFMNGDEFICTGNHRWLVHRFSSWNGKKYENEYFKTTVDLCGNDYIPYVKNMDVSMERAGIINGFIYGDGSYYNDYRHSQANLCGFKREYMFKYFEDAKHICHQANGTICCYPYPKEYKLIPPITEKIAYLRGFIAGLIGSDGCVDRYGCVSISTVKKTDAEKISDICSVLGYRNKITWEMRDTNYKEDSVLYRVVIKKSFLPAEVLLNPKHLERFSRISKDISFTRVAEVIDLEYEEDVYCVQEPETNTMALDGCILTGQCVGYALGRFNEIGGEGFKYLRSVDAQHFIKYAGECKTGFEPRVGACMVWVREATADRKESGHVAIVEEVVSRNEVVTSESGWGCSTPFWTQHLKRGDGNWSQPKGYTFLGFIYNPALENAERADDIPCKPVLYRVRIDWNRSGSQIGAYSSLRNAVNSCPLKYKVYDNEGNIVYAEPHLLPDAAPFPMPTAVPKLGDKGDAVKWLQYRLILNGYSCGTSGIDGHYGSDTKRAVDAFCSVNGVSPDNLITALGGDAT